MKQFKIIINYEKVTIIREEDTTVRYKVTIKIVTLNHNCEKKAKL